PPPPADDRGDMPSPIPPTGPGALPPLVDARIHVERRPPTLHVTSHRPQVTVDRSDYRDAVQVRLPVELGDHLYAKGVQAAAEATRRIAEEGDRLARIEDHEGSSVAAVAQDAMPTDEVHLTLRNVPPPDFTVTPGGVETRIDPGSITISVTEAPLRKVVGSAVVTVDTEVPPQINRTA
ncbi:MAG: DUF6470 family protein, partial [Actinomycetota bacterium]